MQQWYGVTNSPQRSDPGGIVLVPPLQRAGLAMIELAIACLVIGVIASLLGFTSIAGASFAIAKVIAAVCLVVFVILLVVAWGIGSALF